MKSRNKMILSGIIAVFLAMTLATSALALITGVPENPNVPQVYLIKKEFEICGNGASMPPSDFTPQGESQAGCVELVGERLNEYLFTGEQLKILVAVRDLNGAGDIMTAHLLVDDTVRVKCNEITGTELANLLTGVPQASCQFHPEFCWEGHSVSGDLAEQPPAKSGGTDNGFDPDFDKLYKCIFTATSSDESAEEGSVVVVEAYDQAAMAGTQDAGVSVPDNVFLNPAISLQIWTEPDATLTFPAGTNGETVYSMDTLKIKNTAEGGVDLWAWLAVTNMEAADGAAKCPETNVIYVEDTLEFRCKIGTMMSNEWRHVTNPDDTQSCTATSCQNAQTLHPIPIIGNGHTAECWFRFTYPKPLCVGDFSQGGEVWIYARAI